MHPPGKFDDVKTFYQVNHHAFMAHAKTVLKFKKLVPNGKIGASFAYSPSYSIDCNPINAMSKMDFDEDVYKRQSIAMHILNGELDQEIPEIVDMIKLIEEILKMVKYHFNIEFDEESINYYRFVTHLKFFTQRLSSGRYYEDNDNDLFDMIKLKYPKSYECTKRIEGFVKQKYNTQLTKEEMLYLIIHTARVCLLYTSNPKDSLYPLPSIDSHNILSRL